MPKLSVNEKHHGHNSAKYDANSYIVFAFDHNQVSGKKNSVMLSPDSY